MPFINIKANVSISKEKEITIKTKLGQAISLIPGKSESWLMVGFEPECSLYFRGSDSEKIAFVEVKIYGKTTKSASDKLTSAITDILKNELSIEHIYVKYENVEIWGFDGNNF